MTELEELKKQAALKAITQVESGMVLGLGTGSTARYATLAIGKKLLSGELKDIKGIPTSLATAKLAQSLNIPLIELKKDIVDIAIDGMDEVTPKLETIKGLGGALVREKMVALQASKFILIADESKWVTALGQKIPVPIEVLQFGAKATKAELATLTTKIEIRKEEDYYFISDNGNYIFDCYFSSLVDPPKIAKQLKQITGVVEHGIFLTADIAYIATKDGILELSR